MTYALLISLLAGGLTSAILAALWQGAKRALAQAALAHAKTASDLVATTKGLELSEAARADETARLEMLLAAKKAEIAELESDLYACNSPALVRERLRRMLTPEVPASSGGVTPVVNVSG